MMKEARDPSNCDATSEVVPVDGKASLRLVLTRPAAIEGGRMIRASVVERAAMRLATTEDLSDSI